MGGGNDEKIWYAAWTFICSCAAGIAIAWTIALICFQIHW